MSGLRVDLAGLGATVVAALILCYPRARGLAYAMFERWSTRKNTAKTQLEDKTVQQMFLLQSELNAALGAGGDELKFTIDPSDFQPSVLVAAKFYGLRNSIDSAYAHGRQFASYVPRGLEATVLATVWFFIRVSWKRRWPGWTLPVAIVPVVAAGLGLTVCFLIYLYFEGRLQAAVVVAEDGEV